jgi:hypothetical protein
MSVPQRNAPNANSPVKTPPAAPDKKAEDSSSDEEEESVKPKPAKETKKDVAGNTANSDIEKGKKIKAVDRRNEDEDYHPIVCCCDCYLQEGFIFI